MLYLNHDQIMAALTPQATMEAVEKALAVYESRQFSMPERLTLNTGDDNVLIVMPSTAGGGIATKVLTLYPGNRALGLPVIDAIVILADEANGEILAMMDGKTITSMRTGAVTGTSIRHLARADASTVGLVGCGAQGYYQVLYACAARSMERITLYDSYAPGALALQARLQAEMPQVQVDIAANTAELVTMSDVIITATTARKSVFPDNPKLFEGKHFVAIGSFQPDVREYPDAIFKGTAKVWVDLEFAMEESGELLVPLETGLLREEQVETLGHLIASGQEPDRGAYGTTFFKTVGMALFDLTAAQAAYAGAKEMGLGTEL